MPRAFGQRNRFLQEDGRQCRTQGNGDDELKGIELGERPLARDPQEPNQRNIGKNADKEGANHPFPILEQHVLPVHRPPSRSATGTGALLRGFQDEPAWQRQLALNAMRYSSQSRSYLNSGAFVSSSLDVFTMARMVPF